MLMLLLSLSAYAAPIQLVAAGEPGPAVDRAAKAAGVPVADVRLADVHASLPKVPFVVVGAGRAEACASAPQRIADLKVALEAGERHVVYLEHAQAVSKLAEAAATLGCLTEPADPALAARLHYLRGIEAHVAGDSASAEAAFRQAFAYVPDLKWDPNFAPDAIALFEAASVGRDAPAHLFVVSQPSVLWVDGRAATGPVDVAPGVHLVQWGEPLATYKLYLDPGSTVAIVRPDTIPQDVASWAADPSKRADLGAVLGAALGPSITVYVDDGATTWRTVTGPAEWVPVAGAIPDAAREAEMEATTAAVARALPKLTPKSKTRLGAGLVVGGGAALVLGGTYGAYTYSQAMGTYDEALAAEQDDDWNRWSDAAEQYQSDGNRYDIARVVFAVGAATTAGGLLVWTALPVKPVFTGDGAGLLLQVKR